MREVGLRIVMRVDRPPTWANGGGGTTVPPTDPVYLRNFMHALVSRFVAIGSQPM